MGVANGKWSRRAVVGLGLFLAACAGRKVPVPPRAHDAPVIHRVAPGDTLYRIGQTYGVPFDAIARANGLKDPSRIYVGQQLRIPGAKPGRAGFDPRPRRGSARPSPDPDAPRLRWPVEGGTMTSGFGPRNGTSHDGIDIAAPLGAPVTAAADGQVAYTGTLPGYGNVVILRHASGYATVYAHNEKNQVREGQRVRQGQSIATVGRTGRTTGPNLHFEVRKESMVQNPLLFFPSNLQAGEEAAQTRHGG